MQKIVLSIVAVMCLAGFSSLSFADEMGKTKEEMKGEMKGEKEKMKGEMKGEKEKMKGEMKGQMGEMGK